MALYRVYFNGREAKHPWSIDAGTTETETVWDLVILQAVAATVTDFWETDQENKPCCWLAVDGTLVGTQRDGRRIATIL